MPNYLCNNLYLCSSPYSSLPSPLLTHHLLSEAWHDLSSATERTEKIMEKKNQTGSTEFGIYYKFSSKWKWL